MYEEPLCSILHRPAIVRHKVACKVGIPMSLEYFHLHLARVQKEPLHYLRLSSFLLDHKFPQVSNLYCDFNFIKKMIVPTKENDKKNLSDNP